MKCIVTAGPTYETMDNVRRLTNFSTGQLGTELADYLTTRGHEVTLLVGEQATYPGERRAKRIKVFTTTANLRAQLRSLSKRKIEAVFHAAAVSDFKFGKIWRQSATGKLTELKSGKISTRQGALLAELLPTPKLIAELREWFPKARLVGWKFEVDGNRANVLRAAGKQINEFDTDGCVANGQAYGDGFGLLSKNGKPLHLANKPALFAALAKMIGA